MPRQQTLAALVAWSYDLLTEPERTLFNRLSVFAGPFTLEAAEAVCVGAATEGGDGFPAAGGGAAVPSGEVLGLLVTLVDNSLVEAEGAGEGTGRYRLLQTLRLYGHERLEAAGEAAV